MTFPSDKLLSSQSGPGLVEGEAGDADEFQARGVTAEHRDGAVREAEFVGEKFTERIVGAAFDGRSVDFHFQGFAEPADDLVARRVGNGLDRERAGFFHVVNRFDPVPPPARR